MVDFSSNAIPIYQILILVPAALSFIYSISVQCFLAAWHECPWTFHISSISFRLTIFVVATAIFIASKEMETTSNSLHAFLVLHSFLFPAVIFSVVSIILMVRTRKIYITGPKPSLDNTAQNKVVMITGANTGIGKETAKQLLTAGATVIMACRSESRAREAMKDILSALKQDQHTGTGTGTNNGETTTLLSPSKRILFLQCDVSDYNSVRQAVTSFEKLNLPLDVLVNNAGIMMGTRKENAANHELTMACNHLGHFLLTNLLLDKLQKSNDGRVIVVTSSTYVLANKGIDLDDLNCEKRKYTMFSQYAQSKLANILMGNELAKRELERVQNNNKTDESSSSSSSSKLPVAVHMVHPGLVRTDVVRNMPWYLKYPNMIFSIVMVTLQKSPEAGAYTNVFCAIDDSLKGRSGEYFSNSQVFETSKEAKDDAKGKRLWELSEKLVGI
mmetsp:Transcript_27697/g.41026  ORF Transcript_27697/g.41026 Transcript_27697/m.41026 type:complete len:445 (-) Transcript_27697:332-1666(-)